VTGVALALALTGCGGDAAAPGSVEPAEPPLPNVILLLPDTLRADHVGTYGYERDTSPTFDALGARGVVFERAVSQASCTFPSVNSILTSRNPILFIDRPAGQLGIPDEMPTLAEILAAKSYYSVAVSASPVVRKNPSEFNHEGKFDRGFDVFDDGCEWKPASCVHEKALAHLEAGYFEDGPLGDASPQAAGRPFFLYLHYIDPHDPYLPPEGWHDRFGDGYSGDKDFIARGDANPIGAMLYNDGPKLDITEEDLEHLVDLYDDAIAYTDAQVADLLAKLKERGLLESSLVVLVSDHGEEFLEHDHIRHCRTVFDTEIKTPFVIAGPGIEGGRRVSEVVENLDLVPTLLDYLGFPAPDAGLDGASLRPLIEGREIAIAGDPEGEPEDPDAEAGGTGGLGETAPPLGTLDGRGFSWQATRRSLTEEHFKLIYHLGNRWELYDLLEDPGETRDVLEDHRRTFARMRRDLTMWMKRVEPQRFKDGDAVGEDFEKKMKSLGYLN